jgi:hypothetical protein
MVPAPLFTSPPLTFQVTVAAPPLASVAENCSTDAPDELVALQPVQLVSIDAVPGVMEKVPFDGLAATIPPPHPASKQSAGIIAKASTRKIIAHWRATRSFARSLFSARCRRPIV